MAHTLDLKFFDRWSEYSSYVLGYLYASGSIYIKGGRYELTISGTDEDLLGSIKGALGSSHPITSVGGSYRIRISNKTLVQALMALGLTTDKTNDLRYPNYIPKEQKPHFIRGYFDGKGSFLVEKDRRIIINFSAGSIDFLEGLRDELVLFNLSRSEIHQSGADKATNYIRYYVNDTRLLKRIMYSEARIYSGIKKAKYDGGV